eukprot:TRINITY_DN12914_c0_g1_i1.p1 TRINITY_DN12914_c0_g1~~TRINITY_DN12914_c0_g1_i1.p1  ORF type:complete len:121 (-),score=24.80 TRINITY_DN12914_c0_g1_i1:208-570(-)
MIEKKRQEVEEIKMSKANLDRIKKQREAERLRAVKNKVLIQKQKLNLRKVETITVDETPKNPTRRINKIRQEDAAAREQERLIEQMEQQELLLIESLQKTQQTQKASIQSTREDTKSKAN